MSTLQALVCDLAVSKYVDKKKSLSPFLLAELIDNSNGVCPLKNAKINELSDVRAQILYEKDFYKSHPVLNCTVHRCEEYLVKKYSIQ